VALVPARALGGFLVDSGMDGSRSRDKFYAQRQCAIGISERIYTAIRALLLSGASCDAAATYLSAIARALKFSICWLMLISSLPSAKIIVSLFRSTCK